jgi:Predicted membrane protein
MEKRMMKTELLKKYLIFLIGLFISSFGVSVITKADLGTSPISSIPYVLSLGFSLTLGNFTILFNILLVIFQIFILGSEFKKTDLLQIIVAILFGYFIDWTMILLNWFHPDIYLVKVFFLFVGCLILALGVYFEVFANVIMLPGESFVRAITLRWKTDFGNTKVCFDASMTIVAAIISLILFHDLKGVREGTVVAALVVGIIARMYGRFFQKMIKANTRH